MWRHHAENKPQTHRFAHFKNYFNVFRVGKKRLRINSDEIVENRHHFYNKQIKNFVNMIEEHWYMYLFEQCGAC